ncbi:MAG TPA: heavy metal-responsive transcriptional regulator [Gammaproteobacteria bacterium]|nr:heavy metal-responsive transcriptional regulator [Gammaproteobacteria bacterium]
MEAIRIGRLAALSGVSIDTVRYYEREGLLPKPARRASGYREYRASDVERLRFVRRAKDLGFSLSEIAELLSLTDDRQADMQGVKHKAEERLAQVQAKITELKRVERGLEQLIAACPGHGELDHCPIVAALCGNESKKRNTP